MTTGSTQVVLPDGFLAELRPNMKKHKFSRAEKYGVWNTHQRRCWLCHEPLRFLETTIDHVVPEKLLEDDEGRARVMAEYGLSDTFNINGFENWLPCHNHCNQIRGSKGFRLSPSYSLIFDTLINLASTAQDTAKAIKTNAKKDKLFAKISVAMELGTITWEDLRELLPELSLPPTAALDPSDMIHLDNGYWVHKDDVALECRCRCERLACVDHTTKVYCYFSRTLSKWVITAGLYWKCYDEIIECPRCRRMHKRGHVGRAGECDHPYADQSGQTD